MRYILLFIYITIFSNCFAGSNNYSISDIPANLLINSNAVVRIFNKTIIVKSHSDMKERVKYAITILNEKGDRFAYFAENYDKNISLNISYIKIYDKNGRIIKKVKNKEIEDISANPGFILFGDNRLKVYQYSSNQYPYTIEYEYEKQNKGILMYDYWMPVNSYNKAILSANLSIELPSSLGIRYKEINLPNKVKTTTVDKMKKYEWNISNFTALKREDFSPGISDIVPTVIATPTVFEYEGYEGNMTSWNSLGKWTYNLIQGRDILPDQTKEEIEELSKNYKTKKEIVKAIYKYVQNKTRYVCISLGIGGLQPFTAETVDKYSYGDCKALSNYTKSLLKVVGIESFYTEIGAGSNSEIKYTDYASENQTNHIILCVPLQKDTVWLECTSQRSPFNYLGSFTADRYGLLVTKEGGKLVKTQCYNYKENCKESKTTAKLLKNGNVETTSHSIYRGLMCDYILPYLSYSEKEKKDILLKTLAINGQKINSYSFKTLNEGKDLKTERNLDITINNYVSTSGKRVFLPLNIINRSYYNPGKYSNRKQKIVQRNCYTKSDTINWEIPSEYKVENLPRTRDLSTKYGTYKTSITVKENNIEFIRTLSIFKGEYPAADYTDFYNFHKKVRKSEKMQVVLIKK